MKSTALLLLLVLSSCAARGFHRDEMSAKLGEPIQVTDEAIAIELKRRPQLPEKYRVAVYFRDFRGVNDERLSRWRTEEKEMLLKMNIPGATLMPLFLESNAYTPELKDLRLAAAKQGADAILQVTAAQQTYWDPNGLAATYLLVLPIFFVKGSDISAYVMARAHLWDVKNEFLYASAEAEGENEVSRPLTNSKEKEILLKTRKKTLESLSQEIERQLASRT